MGSLPLRQRTVSLMDLKIYSKNNSAGSPSYGGIFKRAFNVVAMKTIPFLHNLPLGSTVQPMNSQLPQVARSNSGVKLVKTHCHSLCLVVPSFSFNWRYALVDYVWLVSSKPR